MSTISVVIVILTALFTVLALVILLWTVVRRTMAAARDLQDLQARIGPDLERLQRDADVTARELDQVGGSLDQLRAQQDGRRDGRAQPLPDRQDDR